MKQNGRRGAPSYKFLVGGFSGRASRIKLLPFGDKIIGTFQTSLGHPAVLDTALAVDAALKANALEQAQGT